MSGVNKALAAGAWIAVMVLAAAGGCAAVDSSAPGPERGYAGRAPIVEVFVVRWCPYCRELEQSLKEEGIPYRRYDIEHDSEGRRKYEAIGIRSYPVTKIGTVIIVGNRIDQIKDALSAYGGSRALILDPT